MSKVLFDQDEVLVINPRLAQLIGLNEAIIIQQIHYWMQNKSCSGVVHDGKKWIYNTIPQWQDQFPFMSESTIKRTMLSLRDSKLIHVEKLSSDGRNHTNYYTINYTELSGKYAKSFVSKCTGDEFILTESNGSKWHEPNNTETTKQRTTSNLPDCPHQELIEAFAESVPELPKPRVWTGKRQKDMAARWKWAMTQKDASGELKNKTKEDGVAYFKRFFEFVAESDFLTGRNGVWAKCDLPWLMKEDNFAKVIEGNYHKD